MTDYRFVSAPEVVLDLGAGKQPYVIESSDMMMDGSVIVRLAPQPVPVEIPEHVVEAAHKAFVEFYAPAEGLLIDGIRESLIAAKHAEEAGA